MQQIGLEAALKDQDFQAALTRVLSGYNKLDRESTATAQSMTHAGTSMGVLSGAAGALGSVLSGGVVIAAAAATAAVAAFAAGIAAAAAVAKISLDTTFKWAEGLDKLGDMFGMSGEQASAWQLAMKHVGLSVDEGTMGLTFFTRGLSETTKKTKDGKTELTPFGEALQQMGVKALDAKGKLKTFDQVMPEIMDAFSKLPAGVESSRLAMELFGARGGSKFLDFLRQGSKGLESAADKAKEFGLLMSTDEANAIEELGFSMNDMNAAFDGFKTQIGMAIMPVLEDFIGIINYDVLPLFTSWAKEHMPALRRALWETFTWLRTKGTVYLAEFANFVKKDLIPNIKILVTWAVENFPKFQKAITDAWNKIKPVLKLLWDWLQEMRGPKGAQALNGLIASWGDIQRAIQTAWRIIEPILKYIQRELSKFWTEVEPRLTRAWANIQRVIQTTWDFIWNRVIRPIVAAITKFIEDHHDEIDAIIRGAMTFIRGFIDTTWSAIRGIIKVVLDLIGGDMEGAKRDWSEMMSGMMEGLKLMFLGGWGAVKRIFGLALDAILAMIQAMVGEIAGAAWNIMQGIWNTVNGWINNIVGIFRNPFDRARSEISAINFVGMAWDIMNNIRNTINGWINNIVGIFRNPFDQARSQISGIDFGGMAWGIMNNIRNTINGWIGSIVGTLRSPFDQALGAIGGINFAGVVYGIMRGVWDTVNSWIGSIVGVLRAPFDQARSAIEGINLAGVVWGLMRGVWDTINSWINSIVGVLRSPFDQAWNFISGFNFGNAVWQAMSTIYNMITGWYNSIFDSITAPFRDAWNWITQNNPTRGGGGGSSGFGLRATNPVSMLTGGGSTTSYSNVTNQYYNLSVNSAAPVSTLRSDFGIMQALAGT